MCVYMCFVGNYIDVRVLAYMYACVVYWCVRVYLSVFIFACTCLYLRACIRMFAHTYLWVHVLTDIRQHYPALFPTLQTKRYMGTTALLQLTLPLCNMPDAILCQSLLVSCAGKKKSRWRLIHLEVEQKTFQSSAEKLAQTLVT